MSTQSWWPAALGEPSTNGQMDGWRYAYFPIFRRLLVERSGDLSIYDTADYHFRGAWQATADGGMSFQTQHGRVMLSELRELQDAAA